MKNKVLLGIIAILMIIALITLTGCGKDEDVWEDESSGIEVNISEESSKLVGKYELIETTQGGRLYSEEDLKSFEISEELEVKEDGTAILDDGKTKYEYSYDNTYFTLNNEDGTKTTAKWVYNDGKLWLIVDANNEMIFIKK